MWNLLDKIQTVSMLLLPKSAKSVRIIWWIRLFFMKPIADSASIMVERAAKNIHSCATSGLRDSKKYVIQRPETICGVV